jgi:transposase InsO family protein
MNREVHVRFWESAGLQCPAPLDYLRDYRQVPEARAGIGRWFQFYNYERPHQSLGYRTPAAIYGKP